jgi:hypothetical protein
MHANHTAQGGIWVQTEHLLQERRKRRKNFYLIGLPGYLLDAKCFLNCTTAFRYMNYKNYCLSEILLYFPIFADLF